MPIGAMNMKKMILILICLLFITGCSASKTTSKKGLAQNAVKATKVEKQVKIEEDVDSGSVITDLDNDFDESEENIVDEFEKVESELDEVNNPDINLEKKLKKDFIVLTDFIFYGGTINGKTFDELSDSVKARIIVIYERIDTKIDTLFPNYKEELRNITNKAYNNIREEILKLKAKYIEKIGEDAYQQQQQIYEEDKERLKEAYEPIITRALEKAEELKDKAEMWYKNFKEENE